jgi:hypothetical protein
MLFRWLLLALAVCAVGCSRGTVPAAPSVAPAARRQLSSGLFLTCSHVVGPDRIQGVITARNVGIEPIALVDRWNSWGAFQWWLRIGTQTAVNPQDTWDENRYTESTLAPGEIRHARFQVTQSLNQGAAWAGWCFLTKENAGGRSIPNDSSPRFASGVPILITLDGALASKSPPHPIPDALPTTGIWSGNTTVRSVEFSSLESLEKLIQGQPLE